MAAAEVRCVGGAGATCAGFMATGGWMVGAGIGGALVLFWSAGGTGTARCGDCSVALVLSLARLGAVLGVILGAICHRRGGVPVAGVGGVAGAAVCSGLADLPRPPQRNSS